MNDDDRRKIDENNHTLAKKWQPESVFRLFADLSAIPRGSGNVSAVADFLESFAEKNKLAHSRDASGNVIIRKNGNGEEKKNSRGVILQAHQDMVCVKAQGADHDFLTDPIAFSDKGDGWLRASGTTLGADDGIGVALALAVLEDPELKHPPLEALFTVDEETDMKGAKAVDPASLKGDTLINLDAEDLGIAYVSSAAGRAFHVDLPLRRGPQGKAVLMRARLDGLRGGHSGLEINKNRANAYVLLSRFLAEAAGPDICLHSFEQGEGHGADNAIPDRAVALISLDAAQADELEKKAVPWQESARNEYRSSDPDLCLQLERLADQSAPPPLDSACRDTLLALLRLLPLGVWRFIQTGELMESVYGDLLVESSCNLGIVACTKDKAVLSLLARSSTESVLDDFMARVQALARLTGATLTVTNKTSGWEMPARPSPVQRLFKDQGLRLLGVHAGLECGCLVESFAHAGRHLDAISVGPDLKGVHSPEERLHVGSVAVLWQQLLAVLAKL